MRFLLFFLSIALYAGNASAQVACKVAKISKNFDQDSTANVMYDGYAFFCTSIGAAGEQKDGTVSYRCVLEGKAGGTLSIQFRQGRPTAGTLYPAGSGKEVPCA